jgi:outer membrane protein
MRIAGVAPVALRRACSLAALAGAGSLWLLAVAHADTLPQALVHVYQMNAQLNAQRAQLRVTDENVSQALSGYRPQLSAGLSAGVQALNNGLPGGGSQSATLHPWMVGVTLAQPLFNGFRTANSVRQAESQVRSGREALRNVEQTVFVAAITAYMGVLADQALVEAQRANVAALRLILESTQTRLNAGDVTPTDVYQAEARLNRGLADLNAAEVQLAIDQAMYLQVVGVPAGRLSAAEPIDRLLPRAREEALAIAAREHPAVVGAMYDFDAAEAAVKVAEGSLMPNLTLQGNASHSIDTDTTLGTTRTDQASITALATVPLYDAGLAASQVRQAKETLAQNRLVLDQARRQTEQAVTTAWVMNEGAKIAIRAGEHEVRASTAALEGVRKEALAGQRTTIDVLNAEQDLVAARARLIQAQRDRVVASYTLLGTVGRLDHKRLDLATPDYEPQAHYFQVRDAWHGLRTPAGQ